MTTKCSRLDCNNPATVEVVTPQIRPMCGPYFYYYCADHTPKPAPYRPPLDCRWARADLIWAEEQSRRVKTAVAITH